MYTLISNNILDHLYIGNMYVLIYTISCVHESPIAISIYEKKYSNDIPTTLYTKYCV